jgi:predicted trehalose synthase
MTKDANEYYLDRYMGEMSGRIESLEDAQYKAQKEISNTKSDFYPWTADHMMEALNEAKIKDLEWMASFHGDDKKLANAVREIVLAYWLESATNYYYEGK